MSAPTEGPPAQAVDTAGSPIKSRDDVGPVAESTQAESPLPAVKELPTTLPTQELPEKHAILDVSPAEKKVELLLQVEDALEAVGLKSEETTLESVLAREAPTESPSGDDVKVAEIAKHLEATPNTGLAAEVEKAGGKVTLVEPSSGEDAKEVAETTSTPSTAVESTEDTIPTEETIKSQDEKVTVSKEGEASGLELHTTAIAESALTATINTGTVQDALSPPSVNEHASKVVPANVEKALSQVIVEVDGIKPVVNTSSSDSHSHDGNEDESDDLSSNQAVVRGTQPEVIQSVVVTDKGGDNEERDNGETELVIEPEMTFAAPSSPSISIAQLEPEESVKKPESVEQHLETVEAEKEEVIPISQVEAEASVVTVAEEVPVESKVEQSPLVPAAKEEEMPAPEIPVTVAVEVVSEVSVAENAAETALPVVEELKPVAEEAKVEGVVAEAPTLVEVIAVAPVEEVVSVEHAAPGVATTVGEETHVEDVPSSEVEKVVEVVKSAPEDVPVQVEVKSEEVFPHSTEETKVEEERESVSVIHPEEPAVVVVPAEAIAPEVVVAKTETEVKTKEIERGAEVKGDELKASVPIVEEVQRETLPAAEVVAEVELRIAIEEVALAENVTVAEVALVKEVSTAPAIAEKAEPAAPLEVVVAVIEVTPEVEVVLEKSVSAETVTGMVVGETVEEPSEATVATVEGHTAEAPEVGVHIEESQPEAAVETVVAETPEVVEVVVPVKNAAFEATVVAEEPQAKVVPLEVETVVEEATPPVATEEIKAVPKIHLETVRSIYQPEGIQASHSTSSTDYSEDSVIEPITPSVVLEELALVELNEDREPVSAESKEIERPKSPWAPSYTVTTIGSPSAETGGVEDEPTVQTAVSLVVTNGDGKVEELNEEPSATPVPRPWTPSYSVHSQGSPMEASAVLESEVAPIISEAELEPRSVEAEPEALDKEPEVAIPEGAVVDEIVAEDVTVPLTQGPASVESASEPSPASQEPQTEKVERFLEEPIQELRALPKQETETKEPEAKEVAETAKPTDEESKEEAEVVVKEPEAETAATTETEVVEPVEKDEPVVIHTLVAPIPVAATSSSTWIPSYSVSRQGSPLRKTRELEDEVLPLTEETPAPEPKVDVVEETVEQVAAEVIEPEVVKALAVETEKEKPVARSLTPVTYSVTTQGGVIKPEPLEDERPAEALAVPVETSSESTGFTDKAAKFLKELQFPAPATSENTDESSAKEMTPPTDDVEDLPSPSSPNSKRSRIESMASSRFFPGAWFHGPSKVSEEGRMSLETATGQFTPAKGVFSPTDTTTTLPPIATENLEVPIPEAPEHSASVKKRWCNIM